MNAPLTISVYNMLEAMLLLYCLFKFDKNNLGKMFKFYKPKTIGVAYLIGIINYFIQLIPYMIDNLIIRFAISLISCLILMTLVLKLFTNKSILKCFITVLYAFVTTGLIYGLVSKYFDNYFLLMDESDILQEFTLNILIKTIQFIIILGGTKCLNLLKVLLGKLKFRRIH